jgi:hypothetical protein
MIKGKPKPKDKRKGDSLKTPKKKLIRQLG